MNETGLLLLFFIASSMTAGPGTASAGPAPAPLPEATETSDCGFMCHMPMAHRDGGGSMDWYALGPRSGSFEEMKKRFHIRDDQQQDWAAFESVVLDQARSARIVHDRPPRTSLEKAEFMRALWQARTEQIRAVKAAFRTLYDKLDPQQQKIASRSLQFCEIPQ